jgi:hypothetical protein
MRLVPLRIGDYSPEAKRAHLYAFWKQEIGGDPVQVAECS